MVIVTGLAVAVYCFHKNTDTLWQIISQQCIPGMQKESDPAPCEQTDLDRGFAVLKDRNGLLQYLLLPMVRLPGIESPLLLQQSMPDFLSLAWQQRGVLAKKYGRAVPDQAIGVAINAASARTQNQLHIHISCLRPDIRYRLDQLTPRLTTLWQRERLGAQVYLIRTLSEQQQAQESSFIRLAQEVPDARMAMGEYGMALASLSDGQMVLIAIRHSGFTFRSAEALLDHHCAILP